MYKTFWIWHLFVYRAAHTHSAPNEDHVAKKKKKKKRKLDSSRFRKRFRKPRYYGDDRWWTFIHHATSTPRAHFWRKERKNSNVLRFVLLFIIVCAVVQSQRTRPTLRKKGRQPAVDDRVMICEKAPPHLSIQIHNAGSKTSRPTSPARHLLFPAPRALPCASRAPPRTAHQPELVS